MEDDWVDLKEFLAETAAGAEVPVTIGTDKHGRLALRIGQRHAVYFKRQDGSSFAAAARTAVTNAVRKHGW